MKRPLAWLALTGFLTLPLLVQADTLLIQHVEQTASIERPTLGQTMEQVQQQWGTPEQQFDPVGTPPISRWEYPLFTVYFENHRVIHSVVKQQTADNLTLEPNP